MKRGFRETVDKILRSYGLKTTSDCIGAVWADGDWSWLTLNAMGYRVEKGISNPPYDYVILSKGKSTLHNVIEALTKIKLGTIIIFRADGEMQDVKTWNILSDLFGLHTYEYGDGKILGVIFKGKRV